jgi:hypothetical protein
MKDRKSETVGEALLEIFSTHPIPKILQSDNGGEFLKE